MGIGDPVPTCRGGGGTSEGTDNGGGAVSLLALVAANLLKSGLDILELDPDLLVEVTG